MSSAPDMQQSQGRGRGHANRGRGGRGGRWYTSGRGSQKTSPATGKFKGNCAELSGYVFDCADYRQADKYMTNIKRIAEYLGAEYKQGVDIRSTIENETTFQVPVPVEPVLVTPATALTVAQTLIFKGQINEYIRREAILQENMQKAYSLILGQCTELLRAKLKQSADWTQVSSTFDVLELTRLIKSIVFKFDGQKFLPVSLHQAKQNFYSLCQGTMTKAEYLEKVTNLVDITSSYDGEILNTAIVEYTRLRIHPGTNVGAQTDPQMVMVQIAAKELCLATAFLLQCNRRRYGKLLKELENDFTKGHMNYPPDMVKAYQLLNEYKQWWPTSSAPQSDGVSFAQKGKQDGNQNKDWAADKTCYECGKKGHIKPHCPLFKKRKADKNGDDDDLEKDIDKQASANKKKKDKVKKAQMKTFMQRMAEDTDPKDDVEEMDLSFCNISKSKLNRVKLRDMLLLDSQSTVDLFCNKKLVKTYEE
jgi:hypothetical protein